MQLSTWGWSPALRQHFDSLPNADLVPARVARQDRTGYLVVHERGETFARIPGHLRGDPPVVGDWVALDLREPATIRALLPRRTLLARAAAGGEARAQPVAANVDVLFLVAGLDAPVNDRRIERYQVLAASAGVRSVLVLNKADIAQADAAPSHALVTSAATGEGIDALRALVSAGTTAAFVGPSGVGKTSLVNALLGREALATGAVRDDDRKGRHTTTARHLLEVPAGGIVLDTPGMRELGLWDAGEGIAAVFDDVAQLAMRCRFRDCAHEGEPGCAVRDGVPPARLAAWRKLRREAEARARLTDAAKARRDARAWGKMGRDAARAKRERWG